MKVLIVEDEIVASKNIVNLLKRYDQGIEVVKVLRSVRKSISWFQAEHESIDFVIMDIQLTDGTSFEIFEHLHISKPIIFTTAYDEYTLRAFKVNSVDYLLKPISFEELSTAIDKLRSFHLKNIEIDYSALAKAIQLQSKKYKDSFLVKTGDRLKVVECKSILYFKADGNLVTLRNIEGQRFAINYSLDALEELLDSNYFFRISRNIVLHKQAIKDIRSHPKGRLRLSIKCNHEEDLILSHARSSNFKDWIDS